MIRRIPFFIHPIPALAIVGMAVNDHWLKYAYPSWVTGKLSDVFGTFYFPLFLCALAVLIMKMRFTRGLLAAAMIVTTVLMFATKIDAGITQWIEVNFSTWLFPIRLTPDMTDLLVLPVSFSLCFVFSKKYFQ